MERIDIVIPLGGGSKIKDEELRYCLRGVQYNLRGYRDIYIIGQKPKWCTGVKWIKAIDSNECKQLNIMQKILVACRTESISNTFYFMNDDHFIMKETTVNIPFYYSGILDRTSRIKQEGTRYKNSVGVTIDALQSNGFDIKNFDCHFPILYEKEKFMDVVSRYEWKHRDNYVIKSLYCNTLGIQGELTKDVKGVYNEGYFSTSSLLSTYDKDYLSRKLPVRSKYEI
jgi:hypothetical protein